MMTTAADVRQAARTGMLTSQTSGLAPGYIQANLLVLPASVAPDFELLCARNPVSCPLLGKSSTSGDPHAFSPSNLFSKAAEGERVVDIRTDIPLYNVYEHGKVIAAKTDIREEWNSTSVAFLIGCSFSFEAALDAVKLTPRQWHMKCNVPMYMTNVKLNPAGVFVGACQVVSMRPYLPKDIEQVRDVTRPFVKTHGEPIAWGWDAVSELGITDITQPDFGDPVRFEQGEVPVFWGCGVTPQSAVMATADNIEGHVMAHKPGCMLLLDITETELFAAERTTEQPLGLTINGN